MSAMRRIAAALPAAILLAAGPVAASAQTPASPIVVSLTITTHGDYSRFQPDPIPGQVIVTFKNVSPQTVKDVIFSVVSIAANVEVGRIDDVGTFSPNVSIRHEFSNSYDFLGPVNVKLVPLRATFADGSTWTAPLYLPG
jgi:hypothetical protein